MDLLWAWCPEDQDFLAGKCHSFIILYSPPCVPDHPPLIDAVLIWLASLCFNDGGLSFGQRQANAKPMPLRAVNHLPTFFTRTNHYSMLVVIEHKGKTVPLRGKLCFLDKGPMSTFASEVVLCGQFWPTGLPSPLENDMSTPEGHWLCVQRQWSPPDTAIIEGESCLTKW